MPVSQVSNSAKSARGLSRVLKAFKYSCAGLLAAFKHEAAFRQEIFTFAVLLPVVCLLPFDWISKIILILPMPLILCVELLNSAIEAIVDDISLEYRERAKLAKDFGSAAVFCVIVFGLIVWSAVIAYNVFQGNLDAWATALKAFFVR